MSQTANVSQFLQDAENKTFDLKHRQTIKYNMAKYNHSVEEIGKRQYKNHELARQIGSYWKSEAINHLDKYLLQFEENFTKNGGKIIWAKDANEALAAIIQIFEERQAKSVVKSKSMTTEEIELNEYLEHKGIEPLETDLGEYIVQLAGQKPYHIVTPAMHLSKEDIADIFVEKLKVSRLEKAEDLTLLARDLLREKYTTADIGITGGNFILPDIGGIAITENEGNARLSSTFPKTHIAVVGIEKMIPSVAHLSHFWPLLATSGTGQEVTVYNTIMTGPRQADETDGPEEMFVVLLDNGRTRLLADAKKREALHCIRCGACLNACPVYRNIGGHSYGTTYSGPIGSIIMPHYGGMENFKHLSYASSLCGACSSVCPVKIDIHGILLLNRQQAVAEGHKAFAEEMGFKIWKMAMKNRTLMNLANGSIKEFMVNTLFKGTWGKRRELPHFPKKSFNEQWKEKNKK
jgi:L-lactate dehydrogenase complex protein LldF